VWPGKNPLVKWTTASSSDPETVAQWWWQFPGALTAIDLAKANLLVLDGDRHGGPDGRAALRDLLHRQPDFDWRRTPTTLTPGHGTHVYFHQSGREFGNSTGNLPPGIDVRGHGGYVICPYAVLADGHRYLPVPGSADLIAAFQARSIPQIPQGIVDLIEPRPREASALPAFESGLMHRPRSKAAWPSSPTPRPAPATKPSTRLPTGSDAWSPAGGLHV
jgi:hypothetical protein